MERIRLGNNIAISWALYDLNGRVHSLDGKDIQLYVSCGGLKQAVTDYTIQGNVVSWVFLGTEQKKVGLYKLILVETDSLSGAQCIDVAEAFRLVSETLSSVVTGAVTKNVSVRSVLTYSNLVGVESVDVVESSEDGGTNLVSIRLVDGNVVEIPIKNGSKGDTGATGATGATGPKGDKGDVGERGLPGIDSVEASIGTNDPTQAPSVDKDLTEGVLSLTFNNIKGGKGDQGEPAVAVENYVTAEATSSTTSATDVLPATGSSDTVYRVSNWDGTQYNTNAYTEYGWYDGAYKMLATRTPGIDDEPTAGSQKLVKSGGVAAQISQLGQNIDGCRNDINTLVGGDIKIATKQVVGNFASVGKLLLSNGTTMSSSGYNTSDFISLEDSEKEFVSLEVVAAMLVGGNGGGISFYSAASVGNFISSITDVGTTTTDNETYVVDSLPTGAKYFRVSALNNAQTEGYFKLVQKTYTDGEISSISAEIVDIKSKLPKLSELEKNGKIDVTNYGLAVDIYINKIISNGIVVPDILEKRNCTSLVKLDKNHNLYANTNGGVVVSFYDSNKQYISSTSSSEDIYYGHPLDKSQFPVAAEYVAFTYYRGSVETDILSITKKATLSRLDCSHIVKYVGTRPRIDIYNTDTQQEIFYKLCEAYNTEDCDVYWENGTYTFDDIYVYMRDTLGWIWTMGLPLGGNCHYYLNNSTIISDAPSTSYSTSRNLFDVKAVGENFVISDGILVNNGGTYCVHDDANGANSPFTHVYKNIVFNYVTGSTTQNLSQCVGCGFGVNASYIFDGCIFTNGNAESQYDCSFGHGSINSLIKVNIKNCYFEKAINLMSDLQATTRAIVLYSANSALSTPQSGNYWEVYAFNNEARS